LDIFPQLVNLTGSIGREMTKVEFSGCIECVRCRLLLPMFAVSVCQASHLGFTVFAVWGEHSWNIVSDVGLVPHREGKGAHV